MRLARGIGRSVRILVIAGRPALLSTASPGRPAFSHTTFAHATLLHTTLLHVTFSHTTRSHSYTTISQLPHTHTIPLHTTLSPSCITTLSHTQLFHIQLLCLSILHHLLCLSSLFNFCFWLLEKIVCGVLRFFNLVSNFDPSTFGM